MEWIVLVGTCAVALVVTAVAIEASHPLAGVLPVGILVIGVAVWAFVVGATWMAIVAVLAGILWGALRLPFTTAPHDRMWSVASIGGAGALVAVAVALAESATGGSFPHVLSSVHVVWELGLLGACALAITGVVGIRSVLLETEEERHRTHAQLARQRRRELQERQRIARKEAIALRREEVARKRHQQ